MKKQLTLLLLVCIFMVTTFAVAQPPFQESTMARELTIVFPKFDYYPAAPAQPHITVFNSTGYIVTDAECYLHIYNNTGQHIFEEQYVLDTNGVDYTLNITPENFTLHDWYSFTAYCNNSVEGGFLSGAFQITHKGEISVPQSEGLFYLPIAYMLFIIALIMLYHYLDEEHIFIRTLIVFLIPALLVAVTGYILKLANSFVGSSTALWFYRFSNWFSYIFGFYFIVVIYLSLVKHYKFKKNKH